MFSHARVQRVLLLTRLRDSSLSCYRTAFKRKDTPEPDKEILELTNKKKSGGMERELFVGEFDVEFPPKGRVYDKKPFRMELKQDKKYFWCSCGHSKNQPLCDGTHKKVATTELVKKNVFVPIKFTVDETKDYFLCNCKQTGNRPFCDGTHRRDDIQEMRVAELNF